MKRVLLSCLAAAALWASAGSCVRVIHVDGCDAGTTVVVVPDKPVHVQALVVVHLDRAAANLVGTYAGVIGRLQGELAMHGVTVDQLAVLPLYGGVTGAPALVYGVPGAGDAAAVLGPAATSGAFDQPLPASGGAEQWNLATLAAMLDTATLPPELTDGKSKPFFGPPKDLFLIVTISPVRRRCALDDPACALSGMSPAAWFSTAAPGGTAAWLKLPGGSYPEKRVYQVFLTTSEDEGVAAFQSRCGAVPGFPKTLLDVMEPSPAKYYGPLAASLQGKGWHAEQVDLCSALGAEGEVVLGTVAARVAQAAR